MANANCVTLARGGNQLITALYNGSSGRTCRASFERRNSSWEQNRNWPPKSCMLRKRRSRSELIFRTVDLGGCLWVRSLTLFPTVEMQIRVMNASVNDFLFFLCSCWSGKCKSQAGSNVREPEACKQDNLETETPVVPIPIVIRFGLRKQPFCACCSRFIPRQIWLWLVIWRWRTT